MKTIGAALLALCVVSSAQAIDADETIFSVKVADMQSDYGFSDETAEKLRTAKRVHRRVGCSLVKGASHVHSRIVQMAGVSEETAKRTHPMVQYASFCKYSNETSLIATNFQTIIKLL